MVWRLSFLNGVQSTKDATRFYEAKVDELGSNLKNLEGIIGQKSGNLRVVEDGTCSFGGQRHIF